jgi:hypothetical protein
MHQTMTFLTSSLGDMLRLTAVLLLLSAGLAENTCDSDGTCSAIQNDSPPSQPMANSKHQHCGLKSVCRGPSSLYINGGTAQAYKPNAPISSTVCDAEISQQYKYKAASWPFTRWSKSKGSAPQMDVKLNLWSCSSTADDCCCDPIKSSDQLSIVEVWQTRPDGTYSALGSKRKPQPNDNDCRAQVPVVKGVAEFTTVAPGSTGTMGGIGPSGWEFRPYGPPVIHVLVRVPGHSAVLLDLPALPHHKTLAQRYFSVGDFRGVAWVKYRQGKEVAQIKSWNPSVEENRISIEVDVHLEQSLEGSADFCPALMYGMPSSFYLEPISMCAPALLDFFPI